MQIWFYTKLPLLDILHSYVHWQPHMLRQMCQIPFLKHLVVFIKLCSSLFHVVQLWNHNMEPFHSLKMHLLYKSLCDWLARPWTSSTRVAESILAAVNLRASSNRSTTTDVLSASILLLVFILVLKCISVLEHPSIICHVNLKAYKFITVNF